MNRILEATKYLKRVVTSKNRILPSFLIIGSVRSETTSLYGYLTSHPNILSSSKKETVFFNYAYNDNSNWYRMYFPTKNKKEETEKNSKKSSYN